MANNKKDNFISRTLLNKFLRSESMSPETLKALKYCKEYLKSRAVGNEDAKLIKIITRSTKFETRTRIIKERVNALRGVN
jgi:hypothetical protein